MIKRSIFIAAIAAGLGALMLAPAGNAGSATCQGEPADTVMNSPGTFHGTDAAEVVIGSTGNDVIRTSGGDDLVCANSGNDRVNGGPGDDDLYGECGNDTVRGRPDEDYLNGGNDGICQEKRGFEEDFCLGGKPFPDTKGVHDDAEECEEVTSAFFVGGN